MRIARFVFRRVTFATPTLAGQFALKVIPAAIAYPYPYVNAFGRTGGAMAKFCNALTKYNHALQENLDEVV
jgi:hypothetical protein